MATVTSLTTSYAGKYAGEYIMRAFNTNESLQHITVKPNIDFKAIVKKIANEVTFANATCDFAPTGTVTINERVLELKKLQVQRQLCINDFLQDWAAGDAQNGRLEPELVEAIIATMLGGIAENNDTLIWTGDGSVAGQYTGLLTQMIGDVTVNQVLNPVPLTDQNILDKIKALITELPTRVSNQREKPKIYMNQATWHLYMFAQIAAGNGWYSTGGPEVPKTYMGVFEIAVCPGLPDNVMVMAQPSNLWFGTNVLSDWNSIQVVDMTQWAEENVRFSAKFLAGTQYGFGNEIAVYGLGLS